MMELFERSLGPSISIATDLPADLPELHTDPNQLEAILLNLLLNARDAMPEGGLVRIEAAAEVVAPGGGVAPGAYVRLSVIDTGRGMDAETLARAVEPFYTTKGVGKGTGLGLSMAHGLMEQLGGRLRLSSRPGEGATVELLMPQVQADSERPLAGASGQAESRELLAPLRILVVDDDDLVLQNTVALLEDLGHGVIAVSSAAEALAVLEREKVQLVITDHAMPGVTGLQLAERLETERPELPVILATGYAELAVDFGPGLPRLSKPFGQSEAAEAIWRAMSARQPKSVAQAD